MSRWRFRSASLDFDVSSDLQKPRTSLSSPLLDPASFNALPTTPKLSTTHLQTSNSWLTFCECTKPLVGGYCCECERSCKFPDTRGSICLADDWSGGVTYTHTSHRLGFCHHELRRGRCEALRKSTFLSTLVVSTTQS